LSAARLESKQSLPLHSFERIILVEVSPSTIGIYSLRISFAS